MCTTCGIDRVGDLHTPLNEIIHYTRVLSFAVTRDPVFEVKDTGINIYKGIGEIRDDIYEFVTPDFVCYEVTRCNKTQKTVTYQP